MSRQELVTAFLEGRVSRRTLIRRLIGAGVSTGAAISYAQMLDPQRAGASSAVAGVADHYPMLDMTIISNSFATVRSNAAIVVRVISTEELRNIFFRTFLKTGAGGIPIGGKNYPIFLHAPGSRQATLEIDAGALGSRTSGRFYVQALGADAERYPAIATAGKTLR